MREDEVKKGKARRREDGGRDGALTRCTDRFVL